MSIKATCLTIRHVPNVVGNKMRVNNERSIRSSHVVFYLRKVTHMYVGMESRSVCPSYSDVLSYNRMIVRARNVSLYTYSSAEFLFVFWADDGFSFGHNTIRLRIPPHLSVLFIFKCDLCIGVVTSFLWFGVNNIIYRFFLLVPEALLSLVSQNKTIDLAFAQKE